MTRLTALLVALAACHRAPARIYTDAEIAKLEAQVMAAVADVDTSCSHQELVDFATVLDEDCYRVSWALLKDRRAGDPEINVDSNQVASVDEQCGAKVLAAFGRAAAVSPSCSPFQIGVRTAPGKLATENDPFIRQILTRLLLANHALRETDPYVALTEMIIGIRVYQDMARGRIDLLQEGEARLMESSLLGTFEKILARSVLTKDQLDDLAANLDAAIASEPRLGGMLEGFALKVALHSGVARLKPAGWQPPGGRDEETSSNEHSRTSKHDVRDDAALLMASGLESRQQYAQQCPRDASLATCYANVTRSAATQPMLGKDSTDRHAARVAMYPDDETRHDSQKQLLALASHHELTGHFLQERAELIARLIAVRLHVQILRDGKCPSEEQLREPAYSTLRAPAVLGDSLLVSAKADSISVDVPAWVREDAPSPPPEWAPPPIPKFKAISIPCPE